MLLLNKRMMMSNFAEAGELYEFIIDTSNSDPTSAVTYAGANANFTPASMNFSTGLINYGSWGDSFFIRKIRPVMLLYRGIVDYELNHSDFTKTLSGANSDVANTSYGGNCMIGFPPVWMKFVQDDSTHQHVYIANYQVDSSFHCYTHQNKLGAWLDEIYIQAFEGANVSNVLRSLSGQSILNSTPGATIITYAQANGNAWNLMDYGEINMLQMLLVLMFKSLDSQTKIGGGPVGGTRIATSGNTVSKPMFYATSNSTSSTEAIKVFGIENLWGNHSKLFHGLLASGTTWKYKMCDFTTDGSTTAGYSTDGTGYKTLTTFSGNPCGALKKMYLNADGLHWYPSNDYKGSSYSQYFCDYFDIGSNGFARFGGYCNNTNLAGLFSLDAYAALSYSYTSFGASLSCKPL